MVRLLNLIATQSFSSAFRSSVWSAQPSLILNFSYKCWENGFFGACSSKLGSENDSDFVSLMEEFSPQSSCWKVGLLNCEISGGNEGHVCVQDRRQWKRAEEKTEWCTQVDPRWDDSAGGHGRRVQAREQEREVNSGQVPILMTTTILIWKLEPVYKVYA